MVKWTSIFIIILSHKKTRAQLRFGSNIKKCLFEKFRLPHTVNTKDKDTGKCPWQ